MINETQELKYHSNICGVLLGMLVGGLAGAVTMLLLAPQSGKDTRVQIQKKGIELRNRTAEMIEDTVTQARAGANRLSLGGRKKFKELKKHGQELVVEQLDHVSAAVKAGKTAVKNA